MNLAQNKINRRKEMITNVNNLLFSEKMRGTHKWKYTYNESRNMNKICINQEEHIKRLEKQLEDAKNGLRIDQANRDSLESQLLSMADGDKAIPVRMQLISDFTNTSLERKQMGDFMFG